MATYSSPAVVNKKGVAGQCAAGQVLCAKADVTCTAAPSTSDTLEFFYLPAGAVVLHAVLESSDMDTNGSPTLTLNVGDSGDADRLFAASTVGQAGTVSNSAIATGNLASYSSKTLITGTANANAATGAAGTVSLTVLYTL
jgi:hypothetical protein